MASQQDPLSLPHASDTKLHVIALYHDRPHYACARCSAVIVRPFTPFTSYMRAHPMHLNCCVISFDLLRHSKTS